MYRYNAPSETSNSATTPVPFSPFSSAYSISSGLTATSDEPADLGAFSTIFRALSQLQRPSRVQTPTGSPDSHSSPATSPTADVTDLPPDTSESEAQFSPSSSSSSSIEQPSDADSDSYISGIYGAPLEKPRQRRSGRRSRGTISTVWTQAPVASYLSATPPSEEEEKNVTEVPSLGAFESALVFLATERARLSSKLEDEIDPGSVIHSTHQRGVQQLSPVASANATPKAKKKNRKGRKEREMLRAAKNSALLSNGGDGSRTPLAGEVSSSFEGQNESPNEGSNTRYSTAGEGITPIFRQSLRSARHQRHQFTEDPSTTAGEPYSAAEKVMVALRVHLLALAARLSEQFPADARLLNSIQFDLDRISEAGGVLLAGERIGADQVGYWDGIVESDKGKVHIFVDHSNILVGFLEWIKKQFYQHQKATSSIISIAGSTAQLPSLIPRKPKLSHASLLLLLERGRKVGKRVLVASSPLHQPLDDVVEMGYEVSVLQRVAIKEGPSTATSSSSTVNLLGGGVAHSPRRNGSSGFIQSGSREGSDGSSTESGRARAGGIAIPNASNARRNSHPGHRRYPSAPSAFISGSPADSPPGSGSVWSNLVAQPPTFGSPMQSSPYGSGTPTGSSVALGMGQNGGPSRPRYREEAVDELLQLKLLQVLIAAPTPPPRGSTIVLATGDGASSQFNRDGFLGCVRQAVERGWRVELVGWEEGRSRAWTDLAVEFRERKRLSNSSVGLKGGLVFVNLDQWGWDLYDSRTSL